MIIHTLSTDAATALELGRRIAATEQRRRRQPRRGLGAFFGRLFVRPPMPKLIRAHA